ncbi:hypothetical protein PYCCODRAFT_946958 [Trametes coccinea BRFM310]|uniref:RecQ-mediated genome instability protein 1 n=1 Tax=Trametes coccinea (strain BRFM310) TaxID=1353009 RepID=A0A1Y2IZM2_TRAC3|nr:hypothetical protein PYCCODRAFT_946958 [Trametes coccinea BRFM310]
MAPPPAEVVQWLKRTYPRPAVDPEWLEGCYAWIEQELSLVPGRDLDKILTNVNEQLLESDFADSMLSGTGFPEDIFQGRDTTLKGPILVEVIGMTEIGHSAYSLMQTYEARAEWRKQAELRDAQGERDAGEQKPMPKYPRSMLRFELSDGAYVLPAIEFKRLPEFELGETPLGCKMIIEDVPIRRGIAFLQPDRVHFMGHQTADRDAQRDAIFLRALKLKLGEPVEDEPAPRPAPAEPPAPPPAAVAPARTPPRAVAAAEARGVDSPPRSPLRDISPPPEALAEARPSSSLREPAREHEDDAGQPRRRKRPSRAGRSPSRDPPPRDTMAQSSRYFSKPASTSSKAAANGSSNGVANGRIDEDAGRVRIDTGDASAMHDLKRAIGLSPPRAPPVEVPDSDDEEFFTSGTRTSSNGKDKQRADLSFGEPGSEDYPFDFEMDDSFLEQVSRVEQEAYLHGASSQSNGKSQFHASIAVGTQVKAEPRSQSASKVLGNGAAATGTAKSRAGSVLGNGAGRDVPMEVIDISDDEIEVDKENVPAPTRHVRRRVASVEQEDVIDLSD